jgi:glucose-6-phosphate 1-dehydrogenase
MADPAPQVLVVFGARGDLAARKLFPGLFRLAKAHLIPADYRIIGSGRHAPGSDDAFRDQVHEALQRFAGDDLDEASWHEFAQRLRFVASSADDGGELAQAVREAEADLGDGARRVLYLSIPPRATHDMVRMLDQSGLAENARLVMEKPFGFDLDSARELDRALLRVAGEESIFRIDHFLGKEAAQNILAFRFANGLLEPVWNRDHVSYVQIDVPEAIGLEGRAAFYEETGALRDMVVTHLMQLLGLVAMEPPTHLSATSLRNEVAKVFEAIHPITRQDAVYGQFEGYRAEEGVADDSTTETFAALRVSIESWRWQGVPFLLRTGKALAEGRRSITIGFREPPLHMFNGDGQRSRPNELSFDLSDEPKISLDLRAKRPGPSLNLGETCLQLDLATAFGNTGLEAYERLLHDIMLDDHTLFTRAGEVERLWEVATPLLEDPPRVQLYHRGSWGPEAADTMAGAHGWRLSRASAATRR